MTVSESREYSLESVGFLENGWHKDDRKQFLVVVYLEKKMRLLMVESMNERRAGEAK